MKTSKWYVWAFVPWLHWIAFVHAGVRAKHTPYFLTAALFGIPFFLAMIVPTGAEGKGPPGFLVMCEIVAWVSGIVYALRNAKEVDLRIAYANEKASWGEPLTLKQIEELHVAKGNQSSIATGVEDELSFAEWYAIKFEWFLSQPMPWFIVLQALLWMFYGFLWIPLWFMFGDKRRGVHVVSSHSSHESSQGVATAGNSGSRPQGMVAIPPPAPVVFSAVPGTATVPAVPSPSGDSLPANKLLDVNSCSEKDIAALPGIGPILAKKAVKLRQDRHGFETLEEFAAAVGLRPPVVEKIRAYVAFGPREPGAAIKATRPTGRVVDW